MLFVSESNTCWVSCLQHMLDRFRSVKSRSDRIRKRFCIMGSCWNYGKLATSHFFTLWIYFSQQNHGNLRQSRFLEFGRHNRISSNGKNTHCHRQNSMRNDQRCTWLQREIQIRDADTDVSDLLHRKQLPERRVSAPRWWDSCWSEWVRPQHDILSPQ